MENWREELNTILEGIDEEETHNEKGWWETSLGAEFGREVKVLIIKLIEQELEKAREEGIEEGWKSCEEYRTLLNRALIGDVNFAEKDELKAMENRFESLRRKYS